MSAVQKDWYGDKGLLLWLKTWLEIYKDRLVKAYNLINRELIPTQQYERALVWCLYAFDVTILTHQMVSLVHEDEHQRIQSVYYLDTISLIDLLKRLENQMNQCRATFDELLTVNAIHRMYVALSDETTAHPDRQTGIERFEAELESLIGSDLNPDPTGLRKLPTGMSLYKAEQEDADLVTEIIESHKDVDQQLAELVVSLEILRASNDRDAVREENLDARLPPNSVRAIKMIVVPGDAVLARQITESYLAKLVQTVEGVRIYKVDYGDLLSRWRGESERNFVEIMNWMVDRARENAIDDRRFDVLWMDNVHALMSQRSDSAAGGEDYLNVIKTTMLQIMDVFNKDKRLSRFALLFSTGAKPIDVDAAFRRRIDNVYQLKGLDKSPAFRNILIKHMLHKTKLNVEGEALERLNAATSMSTLQRLVYAYYVHVRFIIGTEFRLASRGSNEYTLLPLKPYFNLNGGMVRTGGSENSVIQSVANGGDDGPRYFYRPGEIDARNLSKDNADLTVYVLNTDPIATDDNLPPESELSNHPTHVTFQ